jgi:excisionase family DNA binding protein
MSGKPDKLWTPKDLADYLSVEESVVKYWARTQELPCVRLGRRIRFVPNDIMEWIWAKGNSRRVRRHNVLERV